MDKVDACGCKLSVEGWAGNADPPRCKAGEVTNRAEAERCTNKEKEDACGCKLGIEGWSGSSDPPRCVKGSTTNLAEAKVCMAAGKSQRVPGGGPAVLQKNLGGKKKSPLQKKKKTTTKKKKPHPKKSPGSLERALRLNGLAGGMKATHGRNPPLHGLAGGMKATSASENAGAGLASMADLGMPGHSSEGHSIEAIVTRTAGESLRSTESSQDKRTVWDVEEAAAKDTVVWLQARAARCVEVRSAGLCQP